MRFEYLIFNIIVFLGPLLAYFFYPRVIKLQAKPAFFSIFITAVIFISWDIWVTGYFWNFNPRYIIGYKILSIPFEEALFFFTVPFACLFLYVNFIKRVRDKREIGEFFIDFIILILLACGVIFFFLAKYYTSLIMILLGFIWLVDQYVLKIKLVRRYIYWQFISIVLLLTLFFNYYLTSRPVVLYNHELILNLKILTIPIEDFFYSLCLISMVLVIYELFRLRLK